jgi:hypothetical protein
MKTAFLVFLFFVTLQARAEFTFDFRDEIHNYPSPMTVLSRTWQEGLLQAGKTRCGSIRKIARITDFQMLVKAQQASADGHDYMSEELNLSYPRVSVTAKITCR